MPNNGLSIRHECHGYYIAACLGVRFAGVWKQSGGLMDFHLHIMVSGWRPPQVAELGRYAAPRSLEVFAARDFAAGEFAPCLRGGHWFCFQSRGNISASHFGLSAG